MCFAVLFAGPWTAGTGLALAGNGIAGLTTALAAGPIHGRLAVGRTDELVARLIGVDRIRLAAALLAGGGALVILA